MYSFIDNEKTKKNYNDFKLFSKQQVEPFANQWDIEEHLPDSIIKECANRGFIGGMIPSEYGGLGWDCLTYGLFCEAIGRASVSLTGLFNVHTMVAQTILKWGTDNQKNMWLSKMASGELIAALALTEPGAGSDLKGIETSFKRCNKTVVISGQKRWITFGGKADVILVFGQLDGKSLACMVDKDTPGLTITPVNNMLGFKAGHLAVLDFDNCEIDESNIVGVEGFALSHLAPYALEYGRLSVAWTALGIIRACLENSGSHSLKRETFGKKIIEHGSISKFVTEMGTDLEAAGLLCYNASRFKDMHSSSGTEKVMIAKYFSSKCATKHATNAVQILGAIGCNESFSVSRYYRDSKTLEIIEGSNEIHEMVLGKNFARKYRVKANEF